MQPDMQANRKFGASNAGSKRRACDACFTNIVKRDTKDGPSRDRRSNWKVEPKPEKKRNARTRFCNFAAPLAAKSRDSRTGLEVQPAPGTRKPIRSSEEFSPSVAVDSPVPRSQLRSEPKVGADGNACVHAEMDCHSGSLGRTAVATEPEQSRACFGASPKLLSVRWCRKQCERSYPHHDA